MTTVYLCLLAVSDPTFVERLRALAAVDRVAAGAAVSVAHQPADGGACQFYGYTMWIREAERHTMDLPLDRVPWEMVHLRIADGSLTMQLSTTVGGPATPERPVPDPFEIVDLGPGYALVVDWTTAPDEETARRWDAESTDRRRAVLRRYPTKTAAGRSRAVGDLLALATEPAAQPE